MLNNYIKLAIILPALIIALIWITCIVVYIAHTVSKNKEEQRKLEEYEDNITNDFDPAILNLLDTFINDCFTEYKATILIRTQDEYLTDEKESQIIHELAAMVERRISPALIDKVSLYFNKDNIEEIIASKIVMTVANYAIRERQPKDVSPNGNSNDNQVTINPLDVLNNWTNQ